MKKIIIGVLICVMIMALISCGTDEDKHFDTTTPNEEATSETTEASAETTTETIITIIEAKNCFNNAGFIELITKSKEPGEYIFTSENSEAVEWSIYILDEAFDDSLKYIKQVSEPVLRGDGTIFIDKGKYVYVYCSANEFTTGIVDEKAKLKITHCPLLD